MQVNLHSNQGNQFTNYAHNSVTINTTKYESNILVSNESIIEISISSVQELDGKFLDLIMKQNPDIILFGTGNQIKYPHQEILLKLQQQRVGFEVMTIAAMCRTFNYLIGEGRKIVAIVLF